MIKICSLQEDPECQVCTTQHHHVGVHHQPTYTNNNSHKANFIHNIQY
jgi:hypothetical protein